MTPLRKLYGGTNRPQHLRLSRHLALAILGGGLFHWLSHADLVIAAVDGVTAYGLGVVWRGIGE